MLENISLHRIDCNTVQLSCIDDQKFHSETGILGGLTVVLSPDLHFTEVTWAADEVSLTFTTTSGLHYQVQSSNDLLTWYPLGTMQLATGETLTVVDPNATVEQRFYRAIVSE